MGRSMDRNDVERLVERVVAGEDPEQIVQEISLGDIGRGIKRGASAAGQAARGLGQRIAQTFRNVSKKVREFLGGGMEKAQNVYERAENLYNRMTSTQKADPQAAKKAAYARERARESVTTMAKIHKTLSSLEKEAESQSRELDDLEEELDRLEQQTFGFASAPDTGYKN